MSFGMMWHDNDPKRTFDEKIFFAKRFYQEKYSQNASACFVHPNMMPEGAKSLSTHGVLVLPDETVMENHFWIGQLSELVD